MRVTTPRGSLSGSTNNLTHLIPLQITPGSKFIRADLTYLYHSSVSMPLQIYIHDVNSDNAKRLACILYGVGQEKHLTEIYRDRTPILHHEFSQCDHEHEVWVDAGPSSFIVSMLRS